MTQKSRLLSGRVPVTSPATVSSDRYQWLALDQAEPNLGTAANNSILSTNTLGARNWTTSPSLGNVTIATSANIAGITANAIGIFWPNGVAYSSGLTYSNSNVQVLLSAFAGNLNVTGYINVIGQTFSDILVANTQVYSRGSLVTTTGVTWASNGAPYYSDANVQSVINNYTGNVGGYAGANQPYIQYLSGVGNITIGNTVVMGPNATIQFANGVPYLYSNTALQSSLSSYGAAVIKAGNVFGNGIVGGSISSNTSIVVTTGVYWANGTSYGASLQTFSNANVGAYLGGYTGNVGGTLSNASQPYVTSVGTLTGLNVNGGTTLSGPTTLNGTTTVNGNLVVTVPAYFQSDTNVYGNFNTNGTYANLNVTTFNTTASNINIASSALSKLNANAAGITWGPGGSYGYLRYDNSGNQGSGSLDTNLGFQPYWSGNLNLGGPANYWGNIYATGIVTGSLNTFSSQAYFTTFFAGTINGQTIQASLIGNVGTTLIGTISTAAQTNITSLGTLTGLTVGGNATISGALFAPNVQASTVGNLTTTYSGSQINVTSAYIPTLNATYANIISANLGALTGALNVQGVTSLYANLLAASGVASQSTTSGAIVVSGTGGVGVGGNINAGGNVVAGGVSAPLIYGTIQTNAQPYITSVGVLKDLVIAGNLTVQGNNTIIGSADLTVNDSVINLHTAANLAPLTSNDGRDVGLKLHYYDSVLTTGDNLAFVGRANDSGFLEFYNTGYENASNVFVGNTYGTIKTGEFFAANTTVSTSSGTGALRVAGGAGIAGNIYSGGINTNFGNIVTAYVGTLNVNQVNGATIGNVNAAHVGGQATFANITTTNGIFWPNGLSYGQGTFSQFSTANIDQYLPGYQGNLSSGNLTVNYQTLMRGNLVAASATDTTAPNIGAIVIPTGGISVTGNAYVGNNLYIGATALAQQASFANPTIIAVDSGSNYAQIALKNTNSNGSADFAAYADNGTDAGGWVDVGFAGSTYNDPNYTITKPQDGSLITRPTSNTYGGNLIIATSEAGSYNDIVIGVGSFFANSEVARFHGNATTNGYLQLTSGNTSTSTTTGALRVTGGVGVTGSVWSGAVYTNGYYWAANGASILTGLSSGGGGGSGTSGAYYSGITNYAGSPITDLGSGETYVFSAGIPYSDPFGQTVSTYTSDWNELETALNTLDLGTLP